MFEDGISAKLYSHECEASVIGSLMIDNGLIGTTSLSESHFYSRIHGMMFSACQAIYLRKESADLITICNELEKRDQLDSVGGLAYVAEVMKNTPSAANFSAYQNEVLSRAIRRNAWSVMRDAAARLELGEDCTDEVASYLMRLSQPGSGKYEHGPEDIARATVDAIERYQVGNDIGVTYGIPELDGATNGAHNSDLIVIAARPAMGKTAMLLNMILGAIDCQKTKNSCGFISAEMPVAQIGTRICCIDGRVNAHKLRTGTLDDADWARLSDSTGKIISSNLRAFDKSGVSISEVESIARRWRHEHGLTALYVDYLQRIKGINQKAPRWEQVGDNAMRLKELARELDIPVICLAQVNRSCEERTNKRPTMGDIANSSEVEKEADQIMTLYRDDVYDENSPDRGMAEVDFVKNRHGPTGVVRLKWQAPFMKFTSLSESY